MGRDPAREERTLVRDRQTLEQNIEPDLVDERLGDCPAHDAALARGVVKEVRGLELGLQVVELARELVRDDRPWLRAADARVLLPDTRELRRGVLGDLLLDVLHVVLVELGGLAVLEDHELDVLLGGEGETSKNFKRRTCDTTCNQR